MGAQFLGPGRAHSKRHTTGTNDKHGSNSEPVARAGCRLSVGRIRCYRVRRAELKSQASYCARRNRVVRRLVNGPAEGGAGVVSEDVSYRRSDMPTDVAVFSDDKIATAAAD